MALDRTNTNREYLFGRLIGVYEIMGEESKRIGKSTTLLNRLYVLLDNLKNHPAGSIKLMDDAALPYKVSLTDAGHGDLVEILEAEKSEIFSLFRDGDFSNQPFLGWDPMGRYTQRSAIRAKLDELQKV